MDRSSNSDQDVFIETAFGRIALNGVMQIVNEEGVAVTTFAIYPHSYFDNRFFNLSLTQDESGVIISEYVMEYAMNPVFADAYAEGTIGLGDFDGYIRSYEAQEFLESTGRSHRSNTCEQAPSDTPMSTDDLCTEDEIEEGDYNDTTDDPDGDPVEEDSNTGDSDSGGTDSDGSGYSGDGDTGSGDTGSGTGTTDECDMDSGLYIQGCNGSNSGSWHSYNDCAGPDKDSGVAIYGYLKDCVWLILSGNQQKTSDVCASPGASTIIPIPFRKLETVLNLSESESSCLNDQCELKNDIYSFLNSNLESNGQWEQGAEAFANAVIDELANDCAMNFEVDFEERIIIDGSVPQCVKDIINDIKSHQEFIDLGDMPDFVKEELNIIGSALDLFNNSNQYHLIFKSANIPPNNQGLLKNAETSPMPDPNRPGHINFTITLDNSYISNSTDLAISRTIIHESVHAYISYIYQTQMFSDLSNSLRHLLSQNGATPNTAQHQLMSMDFVESIANAIQNWDNSSLPNSDYYSYISWSGGMTTTPAFNALPQAFRLNSLNANIAEGNAGPNGTSTNNALGNNNCP